MRPKLTRTHTYATLDVKAETFYDIKDRIDMLGKEYLDEYYDKEEDCLVFGPVGLKVEKDKSGLDVC